MEKKLSEPTTNIEALLLDMGNVVINFDHRIVCRKFASAASLTAEEVYSRIFTAGLEPLFDAGKIGPEDFHRAVCKAIEVDLSYADFVEFWQDIFWANEPMLPVLQKLKAAYRLVLLSNTNPIHFAWCETNYPEALSLFDEKVLSFRVGHRKPEPEIYRAALGSARAPADRCIFVDDKQEFVEAARRQGIHGIVFTSVPALEKELRALGVHI